MKLTTKTILIFIILFLIATNISVILSYRFHLANDEKVTEKPSIEVPDSRLGRFFRDELNLSNEQQSGFRSSRQTYHRNANELLSEMQEVRNKMMKELNNPEPNRKQLERLAELLGDMHQKLKGLTFDYYFNMQSVLVGEQKEIMAEIFQAMLSEEGYAKTPGHGEGGQYGRHGEHNGFEDKTNSRDSTDDEVFEEFK